MSGIQFVDLKLNWCYYFVILVEAQSFSVAAEELKLSQQAMSQFLRRLEAYLKDPLIDRNNWELTPKGQLFYLSSQQLLQSLELFESKYLNLSM